MAEAGTFYGVGVGPGDPELLTLKAARVLAAVDWIYHPISAKSQDSMARRIVAGLGLPDRKFRGVPLCMARARASDLSAYEGAALEMAGQLECGQSVAWIAAGDPLLYSTFTHVEQALRRRCPRLRVEIVPGVSSIQAAAARVGVPLATLDESVAIVPAAYGLTNLLPLLEQHATVVLLKVHSRFEELRRTLAQRADVGAYFVEKIGTSEQRSTADLEQLDPREPSYFSLVLLRRRPADAPTGPGRNP